MRLLASLFLVSLAGCQSQAPSRNVVDQSFDSALAGQSIATLTKKFGDLRVLMICGPSSGRGLEQSSVGSEWIDDGITDGRIAFVWPDHSAPDYLFRDAGGQWLSAVAEGAEVVQVKEDEASGAQVWVVYYASTGVTETHNIQRIGSDFVDVWTSNKPDTPFGPVPSSAKIFTSNCVRP